MSKYPYANSLVIPGARLEEGHLENPGLEAQGLGVITAPYSHLPTICSLPPHLFG